MGLLRGKRETFVVNASLNGLALNRKKICEGVYRQGAWDSVFPKPVEISAIQPVSPRYEEAIAVF